MTREQDQVVDPVAELAAVLEKDLIDAYGPLITGDDLSRVLGYPSADAFRQALSRKRVPVVVFPLKDRRGKYALAKDVARWLAENRVAAALANKTPRPDIL